MNGNTGNRQNQQNRPNVRQFSWNTSRIGYTSEATNRIRANAFVFDGNAPKANLSYSLLKLSTDNGNNSSRI